MECVEPLPPFPDTRGRCISENQEREVGQTPEWCFKRMPWLETEKGEGLWEALAASGAFYPLIYRSSVKGAPNTF